MLGKKQMSMLFVRLSKWQEKTYGTTLPTGELDRCKEKVQRDLVFIDISVPDKPVVTSLMVIKYGFVDQLAILGIIKGHVWSVFHKLLVKVALWASSLGSVSSPFWRSHIGSGSEYPG